MQFTAKILVAVDDAISIAFRAKTEQGEVRGFSAEEVDSIAQQLPLFQEEIKRRLQPQKIDFYFTDDETEGRQWLLMVLIMTSISEVRAEIKGLLDDVKGCQLTELVLEEETRTRIAHIVHDSLHRP